MLVLEQKLSILTQGPSRTRRNPALDVLTGRVPDERLASLHANLGQLSWRATGSETAIPVDVSASSADARAFSADASASPVQRAATGPTAMVLPVAAIRMAAGARSPRPAPSPGVEP